MRARIIGAPYRVEHIDRPTADRFEQTGHNTGNLLIGDALVRELDVEITGQSTNIDPDQAREENDLILIPSANFLHSGFDMGWIADFVERVNLPVLMVGLGAQSPNFGGIPTLPEGTIRMLRAVSDRSDSIGVRGYYTAEVLQKLGFANATVTGCPSLFRNLTPTIEIRSLPTDRAPRIVLNGSRNVVGHSFSRDAAISVESQVIQYSLERGVPYILQNEEPEMYIADGSISDEMITQISNVVSVMKLAISPTQFVSHIRSNARVFFRLDDWESFVRDFDVSVGSRFHGNLISITQGIPSIVLVHDSRTKEMCELMKIPHVLISDVETFDPLDLARRADFASFSAQYALLYGNFSQFLERSGVPHRLGKGPFAASSISTGGRIGSPAS